MINFCIIYKKLIIKLRIIFFIKQIFQFVIIIIVIGEHNMEDKIKELTSDLSRLQIRNEVLKDEYDNNEKKIEILTN